MFPSVCASQTALFINLLHHSYSGRKALRKTFHQQLHHPPSCIRTVIHPNILVLWNLWCPRTDFSCYMLYNPLLSSPASSAICTPFKPPPSVFLPSHCPLPSYLFHLTPDGALSWNAVGNLRSLVSERARAASLPPALAGIFPPSRKSGITPQNICRFFVTAAGVGSAR